MLVVGAVFSVIAPQGLTWLPALLALIMAWVWRNSEAAGRPLDALKSNPHVFIALALFLVWTMFRSLTALNPGSALAIAGPFFFSLAAVVATMLLPVRMGFNGRWLWRFFPILHALLSVVILLFMFKIIDISAIAGQRFSYHWHYNRAALFTALLWPLSFYVIRVLARTTYWRFLIGAPLYVLTLLAVVSASSQSAQLAFLVISAVQILGLMNLNLTTRLVGIGASAGIMLMPLVFGPFYRWFHDSSLWNFNQDTVTERMRLWRSSLDYIWQSPWIGHGVEYIRDVGNRNPDTGALMMHNHPHSFLFQLWVDTGLVGAAILSVLIILLSQTIRKTGREAGVLFVALMAGILSIWAVSHGIWQSWFVGLAGMICAFGAFVHQRSALLARMRLAPDT